MRHSIPRPPRGSEGTFNTLLIDDIVRWKANIPVFHLTCPDVSSSAACSNRCSGLCEKPSLNRFRAVTSTPKFMDLPAQRFRRHYPSRYPAQQSGAISSAPPLFVIFCLGVNVRSEATTLVRAVISLYFFTSFLRRNTVVPRR